ncbi:hypothetical protein PLICRDRAFT_208916 [Plicaturopsis crispa FD-325 SS-3]|nr:hypothetical protein PLICRDRAFT_208916 [Plicaturopsis crispa FD-325 SS-3]
MVGAADGHAPGYISLRSAEVILSDIRPIKLRVDALRSVNVFLDEFLYNILNAARSLSTEKLREGLLKVLPGALGKEALLEAEVELRAYWERTNGAAPPQAAIEENGKDFHLQWSFELLRLKCEAYSTLNDSDEDADVEKRLNDHSVQGGGASPVKTALVAPAALYLTAILEAICEHILSNVGRVAARDSSRTSATVQDLFVALCEDDSIYGLFKSLKVYEQIESLSNMPKPRRSKSFSRTDRPSSLSRTSSPHHDTATNHRDSPALPSRARSRISSDTVMTATAATTSSSRSSFEKSRAMKLFNRSSGEQGAFSSDTHGSGHKKSDSVISDATTRQTPSLYNDSQEFEDDSMLEEFDNAMRSGPTMKMSLTPDRLKTMESYNKERGGRGGTRKAPPKSSRHASKASEKPPYDLSTLPPSPSPKPNPIPPLRHVDSIIEDDEEGSRTDGRLSKANIPSANPKRARAISASVPPTSNRHFLTRKPSQDAANRAPAQRDRHIPKQLDIPSGNPPRTRRVVRGIEDLDLDDVMGGSDDDDSNVLDVPVPPKRGPQTAGAVSSSTRDLIDFLSTGPPDENFSPTGVSAANASAISLDSKQKGSGRLQRMMSKLRIAQTPVTSPTRGTLTAKKSMSSLSLANRPIPPRPPRVVQPSSPSRDSWEDQSVSHSNGPSDPSFSPPAPRRELSQNGHSPSPTHSAPSSVVVNGNGNGHGFVHPVTDDDRVLAGTPRAYKVHVPTSRPTSRPSSTTPQHVPESTPASRSQAVASLNINGSNGAQPSADNARDLRRLLAQATTADECRLLLDMFLAKCGFPAENIEYKNPYPSPTTADGGPQSTVRGDGLEHSLVELLLGCRSDAVPYTPNHTSPSKVTPTVVTPSNVSPNNVHAPGLASPPHTPTAPRISNGASPISPTFANTPGMRHTARA